MFARILVFSLMLLASPAWAQVADSGAASAADSSQMLMPPPISAAGLSTAVGAEERQNYISGGLALNGGYVNNLYPATGTGTVNDQLYLVQPTIGADRTTDRMHASFTYSPAFTFYEPTSALNTVDHSVTAAFQYRLSPHMNLVAGDAITKTSDTLSQEPISGAISGGLPSVTPGIVVPFAPQVANSSYAQVGWQLSLNDMVGGGGSATLVNYSASSPETRGMYNSNSRGGSGFYTHRLTDGQYIGTAWQYTEIVATPAVGSGIAQATMNSNGVLGFYTIYLTPALSLSVGGGSQRYRLTQAPATAAAGWGPSAFGSLGWQGLHTNLVLNYSRIDTEGAGVIGVYGTNAAALSGRWQMARDWTASLGSSYSDLAAVAQSSTGSIRGGHTLSGTIALSRQLGQTLNVAVQYQRLHQSYPGITAISSDPDSSRESVSITYHFSRPLGR